MFYISPIQEEICRNGVVTPVQQWASVIRGENSVLANQMDSDVSELMKRWLPQDNQGANLTKGFRQRTRYVFGYNGNKEVAMYMKFRFTGEDVHLDWVVAKPPQLGRTDCGNGAQPLPCMLAFMGVVGHTLNLPIVLLADNEPLVEKYGKRGFKLTGRVESMKPEMKLAVEDWQVPQLVEPKQEQDVQWKYGGEGTLQAYLADGTK